MSARRVKGVFTRVGGSVVDTVDEAVDPAEDLVERVVQLRIIDEPLPQRGDVRGYPSQSDQHMSG